MFHLRNTIGRLMKTYLHRPVGIPYFLPAGDFKNVSHNSKILFYSQQYTTGSWVGHITRDFLIGYSCSYYSSMVWIMNNHTLYVCLFLLCNILLNCYGLRGVFDWGFCVSIDNKRYSQGFLFWIKLPRYCFVPQEFSYGSNHDLYKHLHVIWVYLRF